MIDQFSSVGISSSFWTMVNKQVYYEIVKWNQRNLLIKGGVCIKMPGPISSGYTPARDKYKCPVNNCKAENVRGYDITGHFRTNSDLKSLDEALENFSLLKMFCMFCLCCVDQRDRHSLPARCSTELCILHHSLYFIYVYQAVQSRAGRMVHRVLYTSSHLILHICIPSSTVACW